MNKEISKYISKIIVTESNQQDSQYISALFKVSGNLERIGDHAINICEYTKLIEEKHIKFSKEEIAEIQEMQKVSMEALTLLENIEENSKENIKHIEDIEQRMDDMTEVYRKKEMQRMQDGISSDEACILY